MRKNSAPAPAKTYTVQKDFEKTRSGKTAAKTAEEPEKAAPADGKKEIDKEKSVAYIDLRTQLSSLSETQLMIVSAIEKEPTHVDDIVEKTGLGAATVLTQLTVLTVKGLVRRMPGNRVALNVVRRP